MAPIVLWVALACGVDAGYEPAPDGHLEYIIQIEPQLLGSLAAGHDVASEVPRGLDIRHYRLTVGSAALPRIASPAAGKPPAGGGVPARAADQFEVQGRVDEAIGSTTPQIRVGFQATSATGGQYVIEIDPHSLADLNQADLTGDIPPGLPVTRFLISTNSGTAPTPMSARSGNAPMAPATAAVPAVVGSTPAVVDEDPSSWQAEPPTAAGHPPVANGSPPTLATEPAIPDDPPGGAVVPPAAMPPERESFAEPPATATSDPATSGSGRFDPPGGNFGHDRSRAGHKAGTGPASDDEPSESRPQLDTAPGQLRFESASGPLVTPTAAVDDPEPQTRKKPVSTTAGDGDEHASSNRGETKDGSATKPWLPFTLALLALFASLGANVFLGWVAWESYNRDHAPVDRLQGSKASMSS